jgi:pilus assembly protein Flp/PilA
VTSCSWPGITASLAAADNPTRNRCPERTSSPTARSRCAGSKFARPDSEFVYCWRSTISAMKTIRRFLADESGATAIEYGLIAAGISLAIIAVINGLGTKLNTKFTSINNSLK